MSRFVRPRRPSAAFTGSAGFWPGVALALLPLVAPACRCQSEEASPSAGAALSATPPGYRRATAEGWSFVIPESFRDRTPRDEAGSLQWLVYVGDGTAPGAPTVLFARHTRPAEFPSRVFGLTVLEQLGREKSKRVLTSKQHEVGGLIVTDLEVEVTETEHPHHQWRRVFVHEGYAYLLTISVGVAETERWRQAAESIRSSLVHP